MDDQVKIHTNPLSKEGLAASIAKLSTDMEWIKQMLQQLDKKIDESNEGVKDMVDKFRQEQEELYHDHEERLRKLERDRNYMWGAIAALGAVVTLIGYVIQLMK